MKRLMCCVTWLALSMVMLTAAHAQDRGDQGRSPALDSGATISGAAVARSGKWTQLRATVKNPTDQASQVIVAASLGKQSQLQFGRQLWLPPHARRTVEWPAHVSPDAIEPGKRGLETQTVLLLPSAAGGERQWLARHSGQAIVEQAGMSLAMLGGGGQVDNDALHDMASLIRGSAGDQRGLRTVRQQGAPTLAQTWDTLDALIIPQTPQLDAQQTTSLRQWVLGGGRLWVMLDRTDTAFMEQLLGDHWQVAVVDRQPMHRVVFGLTRQAGDTYDNPVTLARVLAPEGQVLHRLGQWPAAMQFEVGQGMVIVTTLSARAWLTPQAKPAMDDLGNKFFRRAARLEAVQQASSELAAQRIGRPIVAQWLVMTILIAMVVALALLGLVLHRRHRLEWMGLWGPVVAVLTAAALLAIGQARQGQVPLTVSSAALVHVAPALGQAFSQGSAAVYSPRTEPGPLASVAGGSLLPDLAGLEGRVVRLLATDLDQWAWQNVEFSSGVIRTGWHERHFALDKPVRVVGQFGHEGLRVEAALGTLGVLQDALIASQGGVMSATWQRDAADEDLSGGVTYLASSDDTLAQGQYLRPTGSILTGTQQRRQAFYAKVFAESSGLPEQPSLVGWTHRLDPGLTLPGSFETQSASAVVIPIDIQPTPAGQVVQIPSPFLPFVMDRLPGETGRTTIFDAQRRQWISNLTVPHRLVFAFQLPPSVLPLEIQEATLTLNLRAPQRTVEVFGADRPRADPLATAHSPSGVTTLTFPLRDKHVSAEQGRLLLVVNVGEAGETPWTMYGVQLSLKGQVVAGTPVADQP